MKTFSFLRPVLTPEINTDVAFRLRAAEKTDTPSVVSPDGSTAALDLRLQADPDPSGGIQWQDIFKLIFTPNVTVSGVLSLTIDLTSILGNAALGAEQTENVDHVESLDTFLTEAGVARIDGGGDNVFEVIKTADYSLLLTDIGHIFTQRGAGGIVIFTLPASVPLPVSSIPFRVRGRVSAAFTMRFQTRGTDLIRQGSVDGSAGGYIESDVPGAQIEILQDETGAFVAAPIGPIIWGLA